MQLRSILLVALVAFTLGALRAQSNYATPYMFTTLAGSAGLGGSTNGTVTVGENSVIHGSVAADRLSVSGDGFITQP